LATNLTRIVSLRPEKCSCELQPHSTQQVLWNEIGIHTFTSGIPTDLRSNILSKMSIDLHLNDDERWTLSLAALPSFEPLRAVFFRSQRSSERPLVQNSVLSPAELASLASVLRSEGPIGLTRLFRRRQRSKSIVNSIDK